MKEATGEMSMTVIVIIAAVGVLALGRIIWPLLENKVKAGVNNFVYAEVLEENI